MKLKNNVKRFLISIIVGASISFSFYPNSSEDPFYTCYGAGWRGSEEKYEGPDENKFKETVVKILENHVHLKKK